MVKFSEINYFRYFRKSATSFMFDRVLNTPDNFHIFGISGGANSGHVIYIYISVFYISS